MSDRILSAILLGAAMSPFVWKICGGAPDMAPAAGFVLLLSGFASLGLTVIPGRLTAIGFVAFGVFLHAGLPLIFAGPTGSGGGYVCAASILLVFDFACWAILRPSCHKGSKPING